MLFINPKVRDNEDCTEESSCKRASSSLSSSKIVRSSKAKDIEPIVLTNPTTSSSSTWHKKRKRRKSKNKQQLQLKLQSQQRPVTTGAVAHQTVVNFPSSSNDVEQTGECSKRDSSSSLGGPSNRHTTLRESLLSVLGKLVVWKGTRYRPTPTNPTTTTSVTNSSSAPPNSPPPTECIGRGTVFFSSGESSALFSRLP